MVIPITLEFSRSDVRPRRQAITNSLNVVNPAPICGAAANPGSKKVKHVPPFWANRHFRAMLLPGVAIEQQF
jgi:hypothetical protein